MSEPATQTPHFDVAKLIADMGGAAHVARLTGKSRTAPYRWIDQGFISTKILAVLKEADPSIDMDAYFRNT